ncbi:hypothetical protein [Falsiroseomonas sp. E2-1-a20]|uniref:hypothetical protein n=1 Tax=Falsiroseomonas sp. E2-1-a20 TaxID=3239300 RepID=UPI003F2D638C
MRAAPPGATLARMCEPPRLVPGAELLRFYALAGRPVAQVLYPDGGIGVVELRPGTGLLVPTYAIYVRLREGSVDLDAIDREAFRALLRQWRAPVAAALVAQPIAWTRTGDGEFPWRAARAGQPLLLRVNDHPAEPLYSLMSAGQVLGHLEDWPPAWTKA